jgi:hypothetical protein
LSFSPPESEDGDLSRGPSGRTWSSGVSGQGEDAEEQEQEAAPEALMTPSRWPAPPSSSPEQGEGASTPTRAHIRVVSGVSEVDDWVGVATSRYSKASDWMEAVGGSSRGASMEEGERRTVTSRGTARSSGEGDYPVFI